MSSRPALSKRQKEHARKEKQRMKAERKQQRKLERDAESTATAHDLATHDSNTEIPAPGEEPSS